MNGWAVLSPTRFCSGSKMNSLTARTQHCISIWLMLQTVFYSDDSGLVQASYFKVTESLSLALNTKYYNYHALVHRRFIKSKKCKLSPNIMANLKRSIGDKYDYFHWPCSRWICKLLLKMATVHCKHFLISSFDMLWECPKPASGIVYKHQQDMCH